MVVDLVAFGAFSADRPINFARAAVCQHTPHTRKQLHRAQVQVVVHDDSQLKNDAALENPRSHRWIASCAEENRVTFLEVRNDRIRS